MNLGRCWVDLKFGVSHYMAQRTGYKRLFKSIVKWKQSYSLNSDYNFCALKNLQFRTKVLLEKCILTQNKTAWR